MLWSVYGTVPSNPEVKANQLFYLIAPKLTGPFPYLTWKFEPVEGLVYNTVIIKKISKSQKFEVFEK